MIKKLLFFILTSLLLFSCNESHSENAFDTLKNQLSTNLKVNSIIVNDHPDFSVSMNSPFEENNNSFNALSSVTKYLISKHYKPNVLDLNKSVIITLTDTLKNTFTTKTKIKYLNKFENIFDTALEDLEYILDSTNSTNKNEILTFYKSDCFNRISKINFSSVNIISVLPDHNDIYNVVALANGKQDYFIEIKYDNLLIEKITCLEK